MTAGSLSKSSGSTGLAGCGARLYLHSTTHQRDPGGPGTVGRYWSSTSVVRAVAITDEDHINKDVPDRVYKYGVY